MNVIKRIFSTVDHVSALVIIVMIEVISFEIVCSLWYYVDLRIKILISDPDSSSITQSTKSRKKTLFIKSSFSFYVNRIMHINSLFSIINIL